jgi:hypothetical protein
MEFVDGSRLADRPQAVDPVSCAWTSHVCRYRCCLDVNQHNPLVHVGEQLCCSAAKGTPCTHVQKLVLPWCG